MYLGELHIGIILYIHKKFLNKEELKRFYTYYDKISDNNGRRRRRRRRRSHFNEEAA
jgi:hypothetical protein